MPNVPVHIEFERQAAATPNTCALWCAGESMTYADLECYANQLAHYLRQTGIRRGDIVAIYLPRSPEIIISILAVLKAGSAFVPMDPRDPPTRTSVIFQDAQPKLMLTQSTLLPIPGAAVPNTVCLDLEWSTLAELPADKRDNDVALEDLAYVMYTSGSTGLPKGVLISHASISNYAEVLPAFLGLTRDDVYLHTASFAFSSSIRQLLLPLCCGAKVVLATATQISDPVVLLEIAKQQCVTILDFVPSYWRTCIRVLQQLAEPRRRQLLDNSIRLILSASEPLPAEVVANWRELRHPAQLINAYGQTETTGIVAAHRITDARIDGFVPIGHPLANTTIHILNERGEPVAGGAVGELHVSGVCLACGYLNQPALTGERFVGDGTEMREGRCYRTGDLVRRRSDGALDFVGRNDFQLKINGIRIEPEEIEQVLLRHPEVAEAAVALCPEPTRMLVAFIVANAAKSSDGQLEKNLRTFLKLHLPDYMMPNSFVVVPSLPRGPSGKITRSELPLLMRPSTSASDALASASEVTRRIAAVWARVLGQDVIDANATFFELGGDSLQAIELVVALGEIFSTDIPLLAVFFQEPTVAGLAKVIEAANVNAVSRVSSGV